MAERCTDEIDLWNDLLAALVASRKLERKLYQFMNSCKSKDIINQSIESEQVKKKETFY